MKTRIKFPRREVRRARIEIVPMIDTIFFLLIFFMFTDLSMVKMRGLGVSVPRDAVRVAKPPAKVVVSLDSLGRCYVAGSPISRSALTPALQARIDANPQTVMVVSVDKSRNVQDLIDVMDAVNAVVLPASARSARETEPAVTVATSPIDATGAALPDDGAR